MKMSERRSSRQRKAVNYRQVLDNESGLSDDDDFADLPPSKKTKVQKTSKGAQGEETQPPKPAKRLSRDDKMYNRVLEQALKESQADAAPVLETRGRPQSGDEFIPDDAVSSEEGFCEDDGDSDFNSSPPPKSTSKKKQKTVGKKDSKKGTKVTKTEKRKPEPKKATLRKPLNKPVLQTDGPASGEGGRRDQTPTIPPSSDTPPKQSSLPTRALSVNTHTPVPSGRRRPKWTPPSQVSKGAVSNFKPQTVSSGSPVIRVGLSRHAKVKPLHGSRTS